MSTPLRERPDAPLGTLIFRAGLLPAETIESALQESSRTGKRLGEILLERNLLEETQLSRLLAGQKGLPFVTLSERGVDADAAKLFSGDQARLYRALPFELKDGAPTVAISDPTNEVIMRNIREALDGTEVQFAVATRSELAKLMSEIYHPNGNGPAMNGSHGANGASARHEASSPAAVVEPEPAPPPAPEPEAILATEAMVEAVTVPEPDVEAIAEPLRPAPEPEPEVVPEPEPVFVQEASLPAPEPVQEEALPEPEPEPEPDTEREAAPPAPALLEPAPIETVPEPAPEPAPAPPPLRIAAPPPPAPAPSYEPPAAATSATIRVVIRLSNNDRVEAAVVGDPSAARAQATALIRYIAGKDGSDWPYIGGRYLRPDAIVSVDLVDQPADESGG
jgi:MshEN domain